jgi:hypothetical protein
MINAFTRLLRFNIFTIKTQEIRKEHKSTKQKTYPARESGKGKYFYFQ